VRLGDALFDMCGNDVLQIVASPDKQVKAVIFERDCGATTGFSTQVSVLASGAKLPNDAGNVFSAETGHHGKIAPSGPGGGPVINALWKNNQTLVVTHHPDAQVFGHERHATVRTSWFSKREIKIEYQHVR